MTAADIHNEALTRLEQGQPLQTLQAWRDLLLADRDGVHLHLEAARQVLSADPLAPVRRIALSLADQLLLSEPGETEIHLLGTLLQHWGEICLPEVPSRALQHFERAWSCNANSKLDEYLSNLYARLGFSTGSYARAQPATALEPWPHIPCAAQNCIHTHCSTPPGNDDHNNIALHLNLLEQGRIWVQRQGNPWRHTHGIAVQNASGELEEELCRQYPWPWPQCPHHEQFKKLASMHLGHQRSSRPPAWTSEHPVLAVAELSGEMFFHWQVELLPRLGRCWSAALKHWPELHLWHNGRSSPWVQESLKRLGIEDHRILPDVDHLQAPLLIVPSFNAPFGQPSPENLDWLESFWNLRTTRECDRLTNPLWLGRQGTLRRPVIGLSTDTKPLQASTAVTLEEQWNEAEAANHVVAAHGAAMTRILGCKKGIPVTEIANPNYRPCYFQSLILHRHLQHQRLEAGPTPLPLQEWLYEGPAAFPIDLRPGRSEAAESLSRRHT